MFIGTGRVYFRAEWVNTLKEKRMVVKSLIDKTHNKFNVSVAEVENQDMHRSIVIGFACVTNEVRHADSMIQNVLHFLESATDAVVEGVETEII